MNMFKQVKAKTVGEYLTLVPADRKESIDLLHALITKTVPELQPYFASNMLGYGTFKYKNYKKDTIDWPIIAVANQKQYISLYICSVKDDMYVAEKYKHVLGKVSVGKSCVRFKNFKDLHIEVLKQMLKEAARFPGLTM